MPTHQPAPYADVRTVGIPRALLFHRYGAMWIAFFEALGRKVVVSEPTTRETLARGDALATDESCLASKIYLGHVDSLRNRCDAVFVPCIDNEGQRKGFCTKFQALPDVVRNTFYEPALRIVTCEVNETIDKMTPERAFLELGACLGATPREARAAWKAGREAQAKAEREACARTEQTLERVPKQAADEDAEAPLLVMLAAHPYLAHDPYVGGAVLDMLRNLGVETILACDTDRKRALAASFDFSETLPWIVNREIIGAITTLHDQLDGIILLSAFPCGPDSMTDDAIVRCIQGRPILNLTVDAQSGTAGIETRIESFTDILRYQKRGGYVHGEA